MASTQGSMSDIVRRDQQLQAERSAARKGRKNAQKNASGSSKESTVKKEAVSQESLHALYRRAREVETMVTSAVGKMRTPHNVFMAKSTEFYKAAREHGLLKAIERVGQAWQTLKFELPVENLCITYTVGGQTYRDYLSTKDALEQAAAREEEGQSPRLDLVEDMCYVMVSKAGPGKPEALTYVPGLDIADAKVFAHNTKVRNPEYEYRFEIFSFKEEAVGFFRKSGVPFPKR